VIAILTKGKARFGIENQTIEVGQQANLSLFNPSGNGSLKEEQILSSSKNCAFLNSPTQGTVYGVINNRQTTLKCI